MCSWRWLAAHGTGIISEEPRAAFNKNISPHKMLMLGRLSMRMYGTLFNLTSNNIEIINLHVQLNNSIIGAAAAAALHSEVTEREINFILR